MTRAGLDIVLPASIEGLTTGQERLRLWLMQAGTPDAAIARVEVVVEEVVMNVVMHGLDGLDHHAISLRAEVAPEGCRLAIEDDGRPFDLAQASPGALATRLEESKVGGLGLTLIHKLTRDLAWQRLPEGRNRLTCVVPLGTPAG